MNREILIFIVGVVILFILIYLALNLIFNVINILISLTLCTQIGPTCCFYTMNNAMKELGHKKKSQKEMQKIITRCHNNNLTFVGEIFTKDNLSLIMKNEFPEVYDCCEILHRIKQYDEIMDLLKEKNTSIILPVCVSRRKRMNILHYVLIRRSRFGLFLLKKDPGLGIWLPFSRVKYKKYTSKIEQINDSKFDWERHLKERTRSKTLWLSKLVFCKDYKRIDKWYKKADFSNLNTNVDAGNFIYVVKKRKEGA